MKRSWLLSLTLWSLALHVSAQDENVQDRAREADALAVETEASAHFSQGVELFREGAYRAALVELQRAHELSPDYRVLFNIGQTQLQLGEYVEAIKAFEAYLVQGGAAVDAQRRTDTEKEMAQLRKRVATLAITVNVTGAEVYVDSTFAGKSPLSATIPVSVGRHRVYAQGDAGANASIVIDVAGGDLKEIALDLVAPVREVAQFKPPTQAPSSKRSWFTPRKRWAVGLLAGSAALGVTAGIFGFLTKQSHDRYQDALKEVPGSRSQIASARDDMQLRGLITDGLTGAALALGVTSLVLFVMKDKETAPAAGPTGKNVKGKGPTLQLSLVPNGLLARGEF